MSTDLIVTRFAPSPTGHLHIGGARTALFCWAFARKQGGRFLMRIEDTDQARSSEASARGILSDLAWLAIDWDEGPILLDADRIPGGAHLKPGPIGADPRNVGPFFQSQRIDTYNNAIQRLLDAEHAYAAFDTPAELDAKRKAATATGKPYRYDRAALNIPKAERDARVKAGEPHVVRFKAPPDEIVINDVVLGEIRISGSELDDFVIRKTDGFPTYHLGVIVDDEAMGCTHVLRGQEHLYNTPKHVALQKALGYRIPAFAHMPLIFNESGAKMSKRERDQTARKAAKDKAITHSPLPNVEGLDEATFQAWLKDTARQLETNALEAFAEHMGLTLPEVSVDDFRRAGYLPEVITNFIALLGWSPPGEAGENIEKFDLAFLEKWFTLERIGKSNARFDRKKLLSFNTDAINAMSDDDFEHRWRDWCARHSKHTLDIGPERFKALAAALRPRSKTLKEASDGARFAVIPDDAVVFDHKAVDKALKANNNEGLAVLKDLRTRIAALHDLHAPAAHAFIEAYAAEKSLGMGKVAQPLRVALTGSTVSPPIDATLAVLGKHSVVRRIERCLETHAAS